MQVQLEAGEHYWCACGLSKQQPFCDGSHAGSGFAPKAFNAEEAGLSYDFDFIWDSLSFAVDFHPFNGPWRLTLGAMSNDNGNADKPQNGSGLTRRALSKHLAKQLGTSRTPVREALRSLESEGLVEITPRRGAVVVSLTKRDFLEAYQVRESLEALGAAAVPHDIQVSRPLDLGRPLGESEALGELLAGTLLLLGFGRHLHRRGSP